MKKKTRRQLFLSEIASCFFCFRRCDKEQEKEIWIQRKREILIVWYFFSNTSFLSAFSLKFGRKRNVTVWGLKIMFSVLNNEMHSCLWAPILRWHSINKSVWYVIAVIFFSLNVTRVSHVWIVSFKFCETFWIKVFSSSGVKDRPCLIFSFQSFHFVGDGTFWASRKRVLFVPS